VKRIYSFKMAWDSRPILERDPDQLFRHAQLESVKAWIGDPAHGALPLHARIQRAIRQLILDGVLDVGRPLPASRTLARSLGVSRDTVESAYSQLHAEGFIDRRVGSGSFVSERAQHLPGGGKVQRAGDRKTTLRLSQRGSAMFQSGGVRDFLMPRPFAPGVPETRSFPLQIWERLERQVLKEYGTLALLHSPPQGMEPLRRAIADYVNLERGARATPERVLVLTSSQQAMTLCATVLLDAGDRIFIEDPAYHGARKAFEAAGLECVPVPLDEDGLRVEHLGQVAATPDERATAVSLTPSHQFPERQWHWIGGWPSSNGPGGTATGSSKTTTTASSITKANPRPACRGSTRTNERSTSAPSPNRCFPACASAIWCCHHRWWRP